MPKSYYFDNAVLNAALLNVAYPTPTSVWVALYTTSPDPTGGGSEVSGGGYLRIQATFVTPADGAVSNTADITYPVATSAWGTITSFAILDAPTAGNILYYGTLSASRIVQQNDQIKFPLGQLTVTES